MTKDPNSRRTKERPDLVGVDRVSAWLERKREAKEPDRVAGNLKGQKARTSAEKFLTRTITGVVYAVIFILCLFLGPWCTTALISLMAWMSCSEFYRIARMSGRMCSEWIGLGAAILFPVAARVGGLQGLLLLMFVLLFACGVWYVTTPRASLGDVCVTAFGPLYTSLAFSSIVLMRNAGTGMFPGLLTFTAILSLWANDALAYVFGSKLGRNKMAPKISPHKTWEGFFGGLLGCVIVWVVVGRFAAPQLSFGLSVGIGLAVGVSGVIGDLFESRIKRGVGVKDSGNVMPGHGGMLDRSDSLLFGCMVAYFLLLFGGAL